MNVPPVTSDEIRVAQILTGATMAAWILAGLMPGVHRYATQIRVVILALYLLGCVAYLIYALVL